MSNEHIKYIIEVNHISAIFCCWAIAQHRCCQHFKMPVSFYSTKTYDILPPFFSLLYLYKITYFELGKLISSLFSIRIYGFLFRAPLPKNRYIYPSVNCLQSELKMLTPYNLSESNIIRKTISMPILFDNKLNHTKHDAELVKRRKKCRDEMAQPHS